MGNGTFFFFCLFKYSRRPGFDPWVGKIPWSRERLPTPVFWTGEFHGLYSPWGRKESDTTEKLSLSLKYSSLVVVLVAQLCPTLCDPMDYGLPGSSGHGLLQARILEWVAMPPSRGSSQSRDRNHIPFLHWQASSLPLVPPGKSRREGRGERRPCGFSFPPASGHSFMKP